MAQAARRRVEANSQRVDALVRSSDENAVPPTLSLLAMSGQRDAGTVMDAAAHLDHVTQGRQDLLREQVLARKVTGRKTMGSSRRLLLGTPSIPREGRLTGLANGRSSVPAHVAT